MKESSHDYYIRTFAAPAPDVYGYTQTKLARTMGVTRRAVYAWEHDKCPESPHLIQLAQFYQVSTDYLLGLTE